uniref:Copia protein n=1 Tax=Tanacetum cinerariifolium TaxID=118510 RepID=A0A6L2NBM5_TANCI|nr:copia protein [Tanacetum cinerariifolium]
MEDGSTTTTLTAKLHILNPREYDLWLMRIEQYSLTTDYSMWEVIKNDNKVLKRTVRIVEQIYEPTSAEEKLDRKHEMKARGTLLMALPNKDQLKFHSYQDSKLLMEAIEKRYGENKESKKVQRTLLKQQYKNIAASSSENLDQTFDSTNNTSSTNEANNTAFGVRIAHSQGNIVNSTSVYNLSDVVICSFLISQPNSPQLAREDLEQINPDNLKEMDLNWEIAMLTIRARRIKKTKEESMVEKLCQWKILLKNALIAQDGIGGYDWSYQAEEVHPTNYALMALTSSGSSSSSDSEVDSCSRTCIKAYATLKEQYDSLSSNYKKNQFNLVSYKEGLQSVEERLAHYKKNEVVFEEKINILNLEVKLRDNALVENTKKLEKAEKERDELKLTLEKFQNSSKSLNNLVENQSISDKGYHVVPPPYIWNYIPPKPDLMFRDGQVNSESINVVSNVTSSDVKTAESKHVSVDVKNKEFKPKVEVKTVRPIIEKIKFVKTAREKVDKVATPKQKTLSYREPKKLEQYNVPKTRKVVRPVWNNTRRVNHKNFANKITHPHPKRRFVPQEILTKLGKLKTDGSPVNTVRPVNTADSKPIVNYSRLISNAFKRGHSQVIRPYNKYSAYKKIIFNKMVNTVKETNAIFLIMNIMMVDLFPLEMLKAEFLAKGFSRKIDEKADEGFFVGQDDQVTRSEFKGLLQHERQTEHINSTNSFNTVVSPVNTDGVSFANTASPSHINAAGTPASTNAFEEHPFERFSPFKNAFSLLHVPILTPINDTGIFDRWAIGTKWVFRNKKDKRGIVVNNKSRLVAQGHTQEEGIEYDEVFAPVARIEAIRLFLAYASFKDFVIYQMDVKSAFLYGKIEEEVYVCQPHGFEDPNFPNKVYKVEKDLYGLHQAPRACQEIYVADILKKFDFTIVKTASTPMKSNKALVKDAEAEDVLSYSIDFTSSCCEENLRYLKGQPKLGLWYPRDSPFDLEAYSDSDYARASLDRKSTTGGYQFLKQSMLLLLVVMDRRSFNLEQIDLDDLKEMDLHWEMAMLTIRARRGEVEGKWQMNSSHGHEILVLVYKRRFVFWKERSLRLYDCFAGKVLVDNGVKGYKGDYG